jgi:hypothetical protein
LCIAKKEKRLKPTRNRSQTVLVHQQNCNKKNTQKKTLVSLITIRLYNRLFPFFLQLITFTMTNMANNNNNINQFVTGRSKERRHRDRVRSLLCSFSSAPGLARPDPSFFTLRSPDDMSISSSESNDSMDDADEMSVGYSNYHTPMDESEAMEISNVCFHEPMDESQAMDEVDPIQDLIQDFGKIDIFHFPFISPDFYIDQDGRVVRRSPRLGGALGSYFKPSDDGRMLLRRSARIRWPVV